MHYIGEQLMNLCPLEVNGVEVAIEEVKRYRVLARPVIMNAFETWLTSQGDEQKLALIERKFLR